MSEHPPEIWLAEVPPSFPAELIEATLSTEEWTRAGRFAREEDRLRFCTGRIVVRHLAASRAGCGPSEIHFHFNSHGKPFLASPKSEIQFNLAHSGRYCLAGLFVGGEVGVDLETHARRCNRVGIARRYFHPDEIAFLEAAPPEAFFDCWTLKEAYVKALGTGLSTSLKSFCVTDALRGVRCALGGNCVNAEVGTSEGDSSLAWNLCQISTGKEGYSAAACWRGLAGATTPKVQVWDWATLHLAPCYA